MDCLSERGSFDDLPLEQIVATFAQLYPQWSLCATPVSADFAADAARENCH